MSLVKHFKNKFSIWTLYLNAMLQVDMHEQKQHDYPS